MNAPDLFGNEGRLPSAALRPQPPPVALDLFATAAEARALQSGRPRSQEHAEIIAPPRPTCPTHGTPLLLEAGGHGIYSCPRCA